ncbi:IS4 family transposase [Roseibium aggregatum]|uniref:IS4 family transposase n=1 Tax=Roseibium aggregatum TaxID=187304 RepID=UPI0025AB910B|nr:IS4 family transposase [Roseibium aggregatum]WJS05541.1 IS4 family transposase [Roseibium aggregatum]
MAEELGRNFLVRSCVDRLAEDGDTTIARVMAATQSSGRHEVQFRDAKGKMQQAVLVVRHATMTVRPPIGKQKRYRHQQLQIIHAEELNPPEDRAPILWKLITNLPVETHADAVGKLEWYALRWKIETFFRTLKTGCRIKELRLTTTDRLANCIALCCVVAWRVSWLTMLGREAPDASPAAVFTDIECRLLERSTPENKSMSQRDLDFYLRAVARLGGYLDRASDPPPGTTVIWRGFSRLADLAEGARIAQLPHHEL